MLPPSIAARPVHQLYIITARLINSGVFLLAGLCTHREEYNRASAAKDMIKKKRQMRDSLLPVQFVSTFG